jgi:hypothetical protein
VHASMLNKIWTDSSQLKNGILYSQRGESLGKRLHYLRPKITVPNVASGAKLDLDDNANVTERQRTSEQVEHKIVNSRNEGVVRASVQKITPDERTGKSETEVVPAVKRKPGDSEVLCLLHSIMCSFLRGVFTRSDQRGCLSNICQVCCCTF